MGGLCHALPIALATLCTSRENEGDLIMAGDYITPEAMAFFVQHTSGVVRTAAHPRRTVCG